MREEILARRTKEISDLTNKILADTELVRKLAFDLAEYIEVTVIKEGVAK